MAETWREEAVRQLCLVIAWMARRTRLRIDRGTSGDELAERLRQEVIEPFLKASWVPHREALLEEVDLQEVQQIPEDPAGRRSIAAQFLQELLRRPICSSAKKDASVVREALNQALKMQDRAGGKSPDKPTAQPMKEVEFSVLLPAWVGQGRALLAWRLLGKDLESLESTTDPAALADAVADSIALRNGTGFLARLVRARSPGDYKLFIAAQQALQACTTSLRQSRQQVLDYQSRAGEQPVQAANVLGEELPDDWPPLLLARLGGAPFARDLFDQLEATRESWSAWQRDLEEKPAAAGHDSIGGEARVVLARAVLASVERKEGIKVPPVREALEVFLRGLSPPGRFQLTLLADSAQAENTAEIRTKEVGGLQGEKVLRLGLVLVRPPDRRVCVQPLEVEREPVCSMVVEVLQDLSRWDVVGLKDDVLPVIRALRQINTLEKAREWWKRCRGADRFQLWWVLQRLVLHWDVCQRDRPKVAQVFAAFEQIGFRLGDSDRSVEQKGLLSRLHAPARGGTLLGPDGEPMAPMPWWRLAAPPPVLQLAGKVSAANNAWKFWEMVQQHPALQPALADIAENLLRYTESGPQANKERLKTLKEALAGLVQAEQAVEGALLDQLLKWLREIAQADSIEIIPNLWFFSRPVLKVEVELPKEKISGTADFDKGLARNCMRINSFGISRAGQVLDKAHLFLSLGPFPGGYQELLECSKTIQNQAFRNHLKRHLEDWARALMNSPDEARQLAVGLYQTLTERLEDWYRQEPEMWKQVRTYLVKLLHEKHGLGEFKPRQYNQHNGYEGRDCTKLMPGAKLRGEGAITVVIPGLWDIQANRPVVPALVKCD